MGKPPEDFMHRFFTNVVGWTEREAGGHFAAMVDSVSLQIDLVKFVNVMEKG